MFRKSISCCDLQCQESRTKPAPNYLGSRLPPTDLKLEAQQSIPLGWGLRVADSGL